MDLKAVQKARSMRPNKHSADKWSTKLEALLVAGRQRSCA
jgi:hypothetical protein